MSLAREIADEIEKDRLAREMAEIEARTRRLDAEWEEIMARRDMLVLMQMEREDEERRPGLLARIWRKLTGRGEA